MTIRDLKDILIHFQDRKYDDWEVTLWDFNNQRDLEWSGGYAFSKPDKSITFSVKAEPIDGETIDERIKRIIKETKKDN